jgi:SAM-dependent methyltransferase
MMTELASIEYLRERLHPRPGDPFYLHLSDLSLALLELIPKNTGNVLDFGCGGSPYRALFGACTYHRADLSGSAADLDFEFSADSLISAPSAHYDCILSSQVLEHVHSPAAYLTECRRLLKPGGKLILSTHGQFEDHACPDDYWRWTASGLRRLVSDARFQVEQTKKLTTGPRAAVFIAEREQRRLKFGQLGITSRAGVYGRLLDFGARLFRRIGASQIHRICDVDLQQHRVVDADQDGHDIYVAIALLARR